MTISAGPFKPATFQFCSWTAVEVVAGALGASQVQARTAQLRCFIFKRILFLRPTVRKGWPWAPRLSKSALSGVVLDCAHSQLNKGDRYAYASSVGNCSGRVVGRRLR